MSVDLSKTLVVGISATALFDLNEIDKKFRKKFDEYPNEAIAEYRTYMRAYENETLKAGTGFPLVKALLGLNQYQDSGSINPLVEVVVMSKNSPETGIRVFNNIRKHGLPISRFAFTGGESVAAYMDAFEVDLFLTTDADDAQRVMDEGNCAVALLKLPPKNVKEKSPINQVRIAFDGDAVIFDESSEIVYKSEGLDAFQKNEDSKKNIPIPEGPYSIFLKKLSGLQERLPYSSELSPIRIAIVTARSAPAELRVVNTLRFWDVHVDEVFFMGGVSKTKVLQAFQPHIFFDDQDSHLTSASEYVPSGKVPYKSSSMLHK